MESRSKSRIPQQKPKQQFRIISGSLRSKPKPPQILCKKHPKHKQSPGVCAVCLREKLNHYQETCSSTQKPTKKINAVGSSCSSSSLSSLSSHESSNASSSCASPHHLSHRSYSSARFFRRGKNLFAKSRSIGTMNDQRDNKGGFWSKMLGSRKKKEPMV